jgi:pimeloyl-ACP methyl ester carboxylesterase
LAHSCYYSWFGAPYVNSFALLSDDPKVDGAVVFVHGFWGDPHETWYAFQDMVTSHSTAQKYWSKRDLFFFTYRSFRNGIETSARSLLSFLSLIFPSPPADILSIVGNVRAPQSLASLNSPARAYSRLVVVGHSEGGLVIRKAVVIAEKESNPISKAKLVLFAPAISGVNPAGFKGMLTQLSPASWIALPFLGGSRAYRDMASVEFRNDVIDDTLRAREAHPEHTALWAKMIFGSDEDVVEPVKWSGDNLVPEAEGQNHLSICKPKSKYDPPITFITEG